MPALRFAFIVNPAAGRGRGETVSRNIARALDDRGAASTVQVSERARDVFPLARAAADSSDVVIAAGGDGTASQVARGVSGSAAALFVLPVGTGNDFAQAQGVRLRDVTAARLMSGSASPIDMGRVRWMGGEAAMLNGLGIGIDARVAQAFPGRRNLGALAYSAAAFDAWSLSKRLATARARIALNDALAYDGPLLMASVGNTDRQGGGYRFTPHAQIADGQLDACIVAPQSLASAVALAARARWGGHVGAGGIHVAPFERMTLALNQPLPVHVDGEVVTDGTAMLKVEVVGAALRLWTLHPKT